MSAEEASFDAWIKLYYPDENSINSQISYYDKGELLGLCSTSIFAGARTAQNRSTT